MGIAFDGFQEFFLTVQGSTSSSREWKNSSEMEFVILMDTGTDCHNLLASGKTYLSILWRVFAKKIITEQVSKIG